MGYVHPFQFLVTVILTVTMSSIFPECKCVVQHPYSSALSNLRYSTFVRFSITTSFVHSGFILHRISTDAPVYFIKVNSSKSVCRYAPTMSALVYITSLPCMDNISASVDTFGDVVSSLAYMFCWGITSATDHPLIFSYLISLI